MRLFESPELAQSSGEMGGLRTAPPVQFQLTAGPDESEREAPEPNLLQQQEKTVAANSDDNTEGENHFGETNFMRISDEQQIAIDDFAAIAKSTMQQWNDLRGAHNPGGKQMSQEAYQNALFGLCDVLSARWKSFVATWPTTVNSTMETNIGTGKGHTHMLNFSGFEAANKELARQLNAGTFVQALREIVALHGYDMKVNGGLSAYQDLLSRYGHYSSGSAVVHHYDMKTIIGIDGGFGVGGSTTYFEMTFHNALGMSWKMKIRVRLMELSAGPDPIPGDLNLKLYGNASAREYRYFLPSYFEAQSVTGASAEYGMGGGDSVGHLQIGDVRFDTSGMTVKAGTGTLPESGVTFSAGDAKGGDPYAQKGLDPMRDQPMAPPNVREVGTIQGILHFGTESDRFDHEDLEVINSITEAILRHEKYYPGDRFRLLIRAYASQRWRNPDRSAAEAGVDTSSIDNDSERSTNEKQEAKARFLNERLAKKRGLQVRAAIFERLQAHRTEFMAGVLEQSLSQVRFEVVFVDPESDDNAAENRSVHAAVFYVDSPLGSEGYNPQHEAEE